LNGDGAVTLADLVLLKRFFNQSCAAASPMPVSVEQPALRAVRSPRETVQLSSDGVDRVLSVDRRATAAARVVEDTADPPVVASALKLRARARRVVERAVGEFAG
jgi:hypothetical protein